MSVGSENLGTGYSRLPQTTSEIESSEDEVSQHENLIYYRKLAAPKTSEVIKEGACQLVMADYQPLGHDRGSNDNHEVHINGFCNINYNYAHGSAGPHAENEAMVLRNMGASGKADDESRLGNRHLLNTHRNPMSAMRRVAFVMSICLCIFTVVAFLWVLPCDWATCSIIQSSKSGGSSWEKTLSHMELIGGINVVPSGKEHHNNLLFLVRGEINIPSSPWILQSPTQQANKSQISAENKGGEPAQIQAGAGGVITLKGSTGSIVWVKPLAKVPRDIDCSLVDLDGSGQKDCVLVGVGDLLCAFDPITAKILWYLNNYHEDSRPTDMDFPLVLPDLDKDGVSELLVICNFMRKSSQSTSSYNSSNETTTKTNHKYLLVVSGKTGSIFGSPYGVTTCLNVYGLALDKDWVLYFTCNDAAGKDSFRTISLEALYKLVKNESMPFSLNHHKYPDGGLSLVQHWKTSFSYWAQQSSLQANRHGDALLEGKQSAFFVSGRKLTILNQGHCPQDCSALAYVSDERTGRNSTIWTDGGENMYVLHPAILSFSDRSQTRSTGALLGPVSGFVLKFWHWNTAPNYVQATSSSSNQTLIHSKSTNNVSGPAASSRSQKEDLQPPSIIENIHGTSSTFETDSKVNDNPKAVSGVSKSINNEMNKVTLHRLKERIVLVTFNDTNMHLVNASESEILQLCTASECQPSLIFQEQSLVIADLDEDGSKELVSYLTTFNGENRESSSLAPQEGELQLISKVRVVRLEAELPKLYEAVTHTYDKSFDSNKKTNVSSDKADSRKKEN